MNFLLNYEEIPFRLVNQLMGRWNFLDELMVLASNSYVWITIAIIAIIYSLVKKNLNLLAFIIAAIVSLGLTDFISFEIVKPMVARERPCWLLDHVLTMKGQCGGSYGFTSNHAANSFAVYTMSCLYFGVRSNLSKVILFLSILISFSRIYLGVHFLGDVAGGALLGFIVSRISIFCKLGRFATYTARRIISSRVSRSKI